MEQRCLADRRDRPGDVYHPSFLNGRPAYFDLTVRNTLQPAFLARGAHVAGIAADAGVAAKDVTHADVVTSVGGDFFPLVVVFWCVGSLLPGDPANHRFSGHYLQWLTGALWPVEHRPAAVDSFVGIQRPHDPRSDGLPGRCAWLGFAGTVFLTAPLC